MTAPKTLPGVGEGEATRRRAVIAAAHPRLFAGLWITGMTVFVAAQQYLT